MRSTTRNRKTALNLELLEDRCVPAGNVMADYDPATHLLTIEGDQFGNDFIIESSFTGTTVRSGNDLTLINGSDEAFTSGPIWGARVSTYQGEDTILWQSDQTINNLGLSYIVTGVGNDSVTITGTFVSLGSITIITGLGEDEVVLDGFYSFGRLSVFTEEGNDVIRWTGAGDRRLQETYLFLGLGDDVVEVDRPDDGGVFRGVLYVDGDRGEDTIINPDAFISLILEDDVEHVIVTE